MGHALRLLSRDGVFTPLEEEACKELIDNGIPERDLPRVDYYMQIAAGEVLSDAIEAKIRRGATEAAGLEKLDLHQFLHARQIYLRGRAAAYAATSLRTDPDFAAALDLAEQLAGKEKAPPPGPTITPEPAPEPEPAFDPAITAVAERLASKKESRGKATDKTA